MFCDKCGKNNEEGMAFCEECGNPLDVSAAVVEAPKASNKTLIIAAGAVLIAIILAIVGIVSCVKGPEKPIKNSIKALETGKVEYMIKTFPKKVQKKYKKDEDAKEQLQQQLDRERERLVEEYGEKFKISYKIKKKEKIDKDDIKDMQKMLDMAGGFDEDLDGMKVSAGYEMKVEFTYKGNGKKDTEEETVYVYKINGTWCLMN